LGPAKESEAERARAPLTRRRLAMAGFFVSHGAAKHERGTQRVE